MKKTIQKTIRLDNSIYILITNHQEENNFNSISEALNDYINQLLKENKKTAEDLSTSEELKKINDKFNFLASVLGKMNEKLK